MMNTLQMGPLLQARPSHRPPQVRQAGPGLHRIEPPAGALGRRPGWARVPPGFEGGDAVAVAVMLHGSGGEPEQGLHLLEPFASKAALLVVAPASRSHTWDGVLGQPGPDAGTVDHALRWVFERFVVDPLRLALGGFSDGASYALSLALANGDLFSRVIALSPGFVPPSPRQGKPRVFISHGVRDGVLPIATCSRRIVPALRRSGYDVDYREFEGGHEIPETIARGAVEWAVH